jgi:hypothetical protein
MSSASQRPASAQSTSRHNQYDTLSTPLPSSSTTAPQRRAPLHPHLQHQQHQAAAAGAIVRGCLLVALLVLVSLAPAAAYFGWFRSSSVPVRLESAVHPAAAAQANAGSGAVREFVPGGPALSADEDHAIRSRLWQKYVGRAPIKHDEALELPKLPPSVTPPNLLQFRERFAKADSGDNGEFIQHAQDARIWLEVADEPAAVFAWAVVEETTVFNVVIIDKTLADVVVVLFCVCVCFFFFFFFFFFSFSFSHLGFFSSSSCVEIGRSFHSCSFR